MAVEFSAKLRVTENGKASPKYTVESDINGAVSLEDFFKFTKRTLILIADNAVREEQARGFPKDPVVRVDGKLGKPVIEVNPLGRLEFTAKQNISDILLDIYAGIDARSPVDTGMFKSHNYVTFNGKTIATSKETLTLWLSSNPDVKNKDVIRFINVTPYARKLERYGITSSKRAIGTRFTKSRDKKQRSGRSIDGSSAKFVLAPNGSYFLTSRQARRKFKNNSRVTFEFVPGGSIGNLPTLMGKNGKPMRRSYATGRGLYLYPCIKIVIDEGGLR